MRSRTCTAGTAGTAFGGRPCASRRRIEATARTGVSCGRRRPRRDGAVKERANPLSDKVNDLGACCALPMRDEHGETEGGDAPARRLWL